MTVAERSVTVVERSVGQTSTMTAERAQALFAKIGRFLWVEAANPLCGRAIWSGTRPLTRPGASYRRIEFAEWVARYADGGRLR